jgi:subtilisin-like proprotein convertase family protein
LTLTDVDVDVNLTHTWTGDVDMDLTSPSGTSIRLHDGGGGSADDIDVTYDDSGIGNGSPYNVGSVMQPSGPGALSDFNGQAGDGNWTMTIVDTAGGDDGTLTDWSVLASGTVGAAGSSDCNGNSIPDECELADGSATDCNGNGTLDSCDIAGGASDCNGNGLPDTCDLDAAPIVGGADDCADSQAVGEGSHAYDLTGSTMDGPSDCDGNMQNDVWFLYTASSSGTATIGTCAMSGSNTDSTLIVYSGGACPIAGDACLASNDDACGASNFMSTVDFPVTGGESYFVQVGGWNASEGDGTLDISLASSGAGGADNCVDAEAVGEGSHAYDLTGSTMDGPSDCDGNMQNDVWFLYTASASGIATIGTCAQTGSNDDSTLIVYSGGACPSAGDACLVSNDDACGASNFMSSVDFPVTGGESYLVQLGGWNASEGNGTLNISLEKTKSNDCNNNDIPDDCEADSDGDGKIDDCDDDDDGDGIPDNCDTDNTGGADCDSDGQDDSCQTDTDGDGTIDNCDGDDDNDGVADGDDSAPLDNTQCRDVDGDGCDDCSSGTDNPANDGTDTDGDGLCDTGDPDLDGDGIDNVCDVDQTAGADCDGDGKLDSCNLADGEATDCDGNGTLDSCDLAGGAADCNGNGVIDSCDIAAGEPDTDANGIPDSCESVDFIRGNANNDGNVDLGDGILILGYLFSSAAIPCLDAADCDDNGQIDITDAIFLFTYQFAGGIPPLAPFPNCGEDPTDGDPLDCQITVCP